MDAATVQAALLVDALPEKLCASCVGRAFARLAPAESNAARGRALRPSAPDAGPDCPLCEGLPTRVDAWVRLCLDAAARHEWSTFLVGSVYYRDIRRREDALYADLVGRAPHLRRAPTEGTAAAPVFAWAEYLKAEINREVGKRIENATGHRVDFARPDLTFEIDARLDSIRLRASSLFLQGRYRKHDRSLPQTHWPCRACNGLGCRACGHRGWTYAESVESLVAAPFVEAAHAAGEAFHGMGREDIDARMLGTGRPFVLELKSPQRRTLDLPSLAADVKRRSAGRVEAVDIVPTDPGAPARFKSADPDKSYLAACRAEGPVDPEQLRAVVAGLEGVHLEQRTPERVAHRRADLVRRRRILAIAVRAIDGDRFDVEIRAESGTYIKEFVSGDEGRTQPSLSQRLGQAVKVEALDVVAIHWPPPPPSGAADL